MLDLSQHSLYASLTLDVLNEPITFRRDVEREEHDTRNEYQHSTETTQCLRVTVKRRYGAEKSG